MTYLVAVGEDDSALHDTEGRRVQAALGHSIAEVTGVGHFRRRETRVRDGGLPKGEQPAEEQSLPVAEGR